MPGKDRVIIANASGFRGDEAAAVGRQVSGGSIDYLTMDYLAEITMIILARQKAESEESGYARDFVALGGGGTVSLMLDNQGKTMAQGLLNMQVEIAEDLLPTEACS